MSLYVLDSDILSLLQHGHAGIVSKVQQCASHEVAITVITVEEQLRGWFTLLRQAKRPKELAFAYEQLSRSVMDLSKMKVLPYSESAISTYEQLRKAKLCVGGNDLRIGAIALDHSATVVTRNVRDFKVILGLSIEDWSKE